MNYIRDYVNTRDGTNIKNITYRVGDINLSTDVLRQQLIDNVDANKSSIVLFNNAYNQTHFANVYGYEKNNSGMQDFLMTDPGRNANNPINAQSLAYPSGGTRNITRIDSITVTR
jgi:hypothetical protein